MTRTPRLAALSTAAAAAAAALLAGGGAARADAGGPPGLCACEAPVVVVVPARAPGWDGRRWGVGLHVGGLSLHPEGDPDAVTELGGGGLHVTYRLSARWGLELRTDHVHEQLPDGSHGELELGLVTVGASFHLTPHRRWDWYLVGGFGGAADAREDATEAEREASRHSVAYLGAGVARRVGRIGLSAEVRALGLAPVERADEPATTTPVRGTARVIDEPSAAGGGLAGGLFTLAATYHF